MIATGAAPPISTARPRWTINLRHDYRRPNAPPLPAPMIRGRVEADDKFLYNAYLLNYRKNHPMTWVPHGLYFKPQAEVFTWLLKHADVRIACFPEDAWTILGFIVYGRQSESFVLHYIYVRERGRGVGTRLLRSAMAGERLIVATHMCDDYEQLRTKVHPARVVYDPYLLPRLMHAP
jgi:hypothetical protein